MGRTITGYEGMPHPVVNNNVTAQEWALKGNHAPVVTCPAVFQIGASSYNWANHNWLTIVAADVEPSNCTIIPKNRNLSTGAVTDVGIVTMGNDEYPTQCKLVSGASFSRLATINYSVGIYLADADNTNTNVSLGSHWIYCKADGETDVSTLEFGTIDGSKLRGKRLAIYMPDTTGVYQRGVAKVSITTTYVDCSISMGSATGGTLTCPATKMGRGTTTTITVTTNEGYRLKSLKAYRKGTTTETGTLKANSNGTYTFTMGTPAYDTVITPVWEQINYTITVKPNYPNVATITAPATAHFNDTVNISQTVTDNEYQFQSWLWNTTAISISNGKGSFKMPSANVDLYVNYLKHTLTWTNPSLKVVQSDAFLHFTETGTLTDNFNYFSITNPEPNTPDKDKLYEGHNGYYVLKSAPTKIYLYRNGITTGVEFTYNSQSRTYTATLPITDADTKIEYEYKTVAVNTVSSTGGVVVFSANELHQTVFYYWDGDFQECIPYCYDGKKWVEAQAMYCTGVQIYNKTTDEYRPFDYDDWEHIELADDEVRVGSWQICSGI